LDALDDKDRARVVESRDFQLDRAGDLLKGMLMYSELSRPEKVAAK
jgi:hypothetical protein